MDVDACVWILCMIHYVFGVIMWFYDRSMLGLDSSGWLDDFLRAYYGYMITRVCDGYLMILFHDFTKDVSMDIMWIIVVVTRYVQYA